MMKKLLVLMLVLATASLASATVIDVVLDGAGDAGHAGTAGDLLVNGETIGIKIVLNFNDYPLGSSSYDGYGLSSYDLNLTASSGGSLGNLVTVMGADMTAKHTSTGATFTKNNITNGFNMLAVCSPLVTGAEGVPTDMIWNLTATADGTGNIVIDLGLNGQSDYSNYVNFDQTSEYPAGWLQLVEGQLGDLTIYAPEPMTMALLGLGGLFLRRRK